MKTTKMSLATVQDYPGHTEMKKLFFFILMLLLFLLQGCKRTNAITLHVTVTNDVCQSGQWVYWFSVHGNEYNIEDSSYLPKGQHSFTMKKVIPDMDADMWCWLTFAKHGPTETYLFLNKGEDVKLTINKKGITKTAGSPGNKEMYNYWHKAMKIRLIINSLTDALETTKDSIVQKKIIDKIQNFKDSLNFKLPLDVFKNIKNPKIFLLQLAVVEKGFPRKTVDSLVKVMKQRFPSNKIVQEYPQHQKYPPATLHSKQFYRRWLKILTKKTGHSFKRPPTPKLLAGQKKALSKIKPLKLGDNVVSLSFKGLDGKKIALKDIHTPYVLIDFWASWCTPCREEVPDLKLVQAKYKGRLTIFAVSLDKNESKWREAIRIDKSNRLTQVIEDSSQFTRKWIQKLFWIKFIPRNFLLDQQRKIIAINIPGDSLERKLGKLFRK